LYRVRFDRGEVSFPVQAIGDAPEGLRGSKITFHPDPLIFRDVEGFDYQRIKRRLRELAYLTGGVKIIITDERGTELRREVFHEKGGVAAFAANLAKDSKALYEEAILMKGIAKVDVNESTEEVEVEVGLIHTASYGN